MKRKLRTRTKVQWNRCTEQMHKINLGLHDGEVQLLFAAVRRQLGLVGPQALMHPALACSQDRL